SLKTLYRKRTVIWPFYFYTIIRTLSKNNLIFENILHFSKIKHII
ncbi:glyoxalase, partial [Staphylococcus aureus]